MTHTAGSQTDYVWDVKRSLPEILQETAGSNTTSYVYGIGRISSTDGSGNQTYYTGDGLGSTTDLTNGANPPQQTDGYTYDEFGAATQSPSGSTQPFQFTGQQADADSGLQYLRARYYDPGIGRLLAPDPAPGSLAVPSSQNHYVYALNNPASLDDPSGLCAKSCEGGPSARGATPVLTTMPSWSIGWGLIDATLALIVKYQSCIKAGITAAATISGFGWAPVLLAAASNASISASTGQGNPVEDVTTGVGLRGGAELIVVTGELTGFEALATATELNALAGAIYTARESVNCILLLGNELRNLLS